MCNNLSFDLLCIGATIGTHGDIQCPPLCKVFFNGALLCVGRLCTQKMALQLHPLAGTSIDRYIHWQVHKLIGTSIARYIH